jgi:hypothetical protein
MCLECHRDLGKAAELINASVSRHPAHRTVHEVATAAEAVRDTGALDTYLSLPVALASGPLVTS